MCERCKRLVAVVDAKLDKTMDVQQAVVELVEIRTELLTHEPMDSKMVYDLDTALAMMQPYLIKPYFMEMW